MKGINIEVYKIEPRMVAVHGKFWVLGKQGDENPPN
jgi:hypothetical protein